MQKTLLLVSLAMVSSIALAADTDTSLEPCINGEVSRTGNFPTQKMEDQIHAYLKWQAVDPYYLFRTEGRKITAAYPEK